MISAASVQVKRFLFDSLVFGTPLSNSSYNGLTVQICKLLMKKIYIQIIYNCVLLYGVIQACIYYNHVILAHTSFLVPQMIAENEILT